MFSCYTLVTMADDNSRLLLEEEKEFKRTYKLSLWWVEHRASIKRLGLGVFMFFDAVLLLFVIWTFLDTYAVSYDKELKAIEGVVIQGVSDLRSYTTARSAQDIDEEEVRVFSIGENRYDFYAMLSNPNLDWWVEFDYQFSYNDTETKIQHAVFLPEQRKPVVDLAISSVSSIRSAEFLLTNVVWHRVDHHEIGDYETWYEKRSSINISDETFRKESTESKTIGVSMFSVVNQTAYSYFNPTFIVLLKQGNNVVGISSVAVSSLDSLERKEISLNWFGTLPGVTTIEVIPDINFLDPKVYKRDKGVLDGDVRTRPIIQ